MKLIFVGRVLGAETFNNITTSCGINRWQALPVADYLYILRPLGSNQFKTPFNTTHDYENITF